MLTKNFRGLVAGLCIMLVGVFSAGTASAYSLAGINTSGSPAFINDVKVTLNPNNGTIKLSGRKDFLFNDGVGLVDGNSSRYTMNLSFDYDGVNVTSLGGTVSLIGGISSLGIGKNTLLMSADVTSMNITEDSNLWGFNTTNLFCDPALLITCTADESIYVILDNAFSGNFNGNFKSTGFAVTTVPVPAAVWLFGSALGLLGWIRRRTLISV